MQRSFSCTRKLKNPAACKECWNRQGQRQNLWICLLSSCVQREAWADNAEQLGKKITSLPELANFPITQHTYSAILWQHNLTLKKPVFFTNLQKVFFARKGTWFFCTYKKDSLFHAMSTCNFLYLSGVHYHCWYRSLQFSYSCSWCWLDLLLFCFIVLLRLWMRSVHEASCTTRRSTPGHCIN